MHTDFASIIVASLSGLFAQLPNVLPGIENYSRQQEKSFEQDIRGFLSFYVFFQTCVSKCPSETVNKESLRQFSSFFLDQVVISAINACSDFDGSTISSLFYIQKLIDWTENDAVFRIFAKFLLEGDSDDDAELTTLKPRDILLCKLNSLSEDVATSVIQILTSLLHKDGIAV